MSTILIKNARMRGHQELTDLYIKDGVFAEIGAGFLTLPMRSSMSPASWSPPRSAMPICIWMLSSASASPATI